jgi:hypothetical protein
VAAAGAVVAGAENAAVAEDAWTPTDGLKLRFVWPGHPPTFSHSLTFLLLYLSVVSGFGMPVALLSRCVDLMAQRCPAQNVCVCVCVVNNMYSPTRNGFVRSLNARIILCMATDD